MLSDIKGKVTQRKNDMPHAEYLMPFRISQKQHARKYADRNVTLRFFNCVSITYKIATQRVRLVKTYVVLQFPVTSQSFSYSCNCLSLKMRFYDVFLLEKYVETIICDGSPLKHGRRVDWRQLCR
jgi:hypothetical protein